MISEEEKLSIIKKLKEEMENAKIHFEKLVYNIEKLEDIFYENSEN